MRGASLEGAKKMASTMEYIEEIDVPVYERDIVPFLPPVIFDAHLHVYSAPEKRDSSDPSQPSVVDRYPAEDAEENFLRAFPKHRFEALWFSTVGAHRDTAADNAYVAECCRRIPGRYGLMVARPTDSAEYLERQIRELGMLGFKPYWTLASAAFGTPQNEVTVLQMVSEAMISVADRLGLIIMLHIPRAGRLSDPSNIKEVRELCRRAPNARVVLAHVGRSYTADSVRDLPRYADIPNLWTDFSNVQNWEVMSEVFRVFDRKKILYGSDFPVAQTRGKVIDVNGQRHFFTARPYKWSVHNPGPAYPIRCTLFVYEIVREALKAALRMGLRKEEIHDIFYGNAKRLVAEVGKSIRA
jgi:predicted TIM-barrel fold metal-dependent hydrolase